MLACVLTGLFQTQIHAASIDGTTNPVWRTTHWTASNGNKATGFVKFLKGFDIPAGTSVTLETSESVDGTIDLNDSGKLILQRHLTLAPDARLTRGGIIDGRAHDIILEGNITIPTGKNLHITSTTAIDGNGNTLYLEPHASITVDNNVTLTLRNVRVKNTYNRFSNQIIHPVGNRTHIALQNVELALADDFTFYDGQLFIHDDVLVTGSSVFSYRSTQTSYICDAATLGFDKDTTFWYNPSSIDNHLMQMQSKTATMYFNGSKLFATYPGLRLSKGMLCLDNNVTLCGTTKSISTITPLSSPTDGKDQGADGANSVSWSPDGSQVAIGTSANPSTSETNITANYELRVYNFNDTTGTLTGAASADTASITINAVAWRPVGNYIAVGTAAWSGANEVRVYNLTGGTLSLQSSANLQEGWPYSGHRSALSVSWSPNGNYLAVGAQSGSFFNELRIYSFNGTTLSFVTSLDVGTAIANYNAFTVAWSPDNNYVAIGTAGGYNKEVRVYKFTGSALTNAVLIPIDLGTQVNTVSWNPDGSYLAVGTNARSGAEVLVYYFTGTALYPISGAQVELGTKVNAVSWSPDGTYIALGANAGLITQARIYEFTGGTLNFVTQIPSTLGVNVKSISWRHDGSYLAIGTAAGASAGELQIYGVNYLEQTPAQTFDNGIIFGDSSQAYGSGNLDVRVLAGAKVKVSGKVSYDNS